MFISLVIMYQRGLVSLIIILGFSCSVACCKAHKEACSTSVIVDDTETEETLRIPPVHTPDKLSSSTRLQEFLALNPYLQAQLPVLLARIDRAEPAFTLQAGSELARELERKERVGSVLREAVDTDPIVGELYRILQEENLI